MGMTAQPGIMDISLYQGGASKIDGVSDVIKLSSNENPYGASRRALDAFRQAAGNLHVYPSTDHRELREAIAEVHEMDPERIVCGVGSDEIISFLCYAFAGPGAEVLYPEHGFSMYRISALAAGADPVIAPETERTVDVDALLAAVTERTRLVFLANPANPTGTMVDDEALERLASSLPDECLLVLDGAYAEYVDGFDAGRELIDARGNVFMTRTFSKIYGLGGMRVGWGYGPQEIIDVLNRLRGPFNLSGPALAAAEAAMRDQTFVARCRSDNTRWKSWLANALNSVGVPSDEAHGNFILARFSSEAEADACDAFLKGRGIIVRMVKGYGLPNCLRITVGDQQACKKVAAAVADFKGQA